MSVWRYRAVPLSVASAQTGASTARTGELVGDTAEDVRASLRRIGLQVIELHPVRSRDASALPFASVWQRHLRTRRQPAKSELFDGLATMLRSGLPLLEAVETLVGAAGRRDRARRTMLLQLADTLRAGDTLASAMRAQPTWFDTVEIAMVDAGQVGGTLPDVLATLSERHARSGDLSHKLIGALAYPAIVALVGIGVVIFLSVKVLPDLVAILTDSNIDVPLLTRTIMVLGDGLLTLWPILLLTPILIAAAITVTTRIMRARGLQPPDRLRRLVPAVFRKLATARLAHGLAALVRTGIPMVDAVRVIAPTLGTNAGLRATLEHAAARVERGDDLADALNDPLWFDDEFRRLLDIGQASGELPTLLERIGDRYERQATRMIDRLTALLEPAVILALAVLVGLVVMGAILPLVRLQEVL